MLCLRRSLFHLICCCLGPSGVQRHPNTRRIVVNDEESFSEEMSSEEDSHESSDDQLPDEESEASFTPENEGLFTFF